MKKSVIGITVGLLLFAFPVFAANPKADVQGQIQQKRAALKEQIAKIKDKKKQEILSRVYENVNALNKRTTDHFQKALDQIAKVLDRVKSRADKAKAHDKDVSQVQAAITKATDAISKARAAVQAQAAKVYSFPVIKETTLKKDVGAARQTLHADLAKVRDAVKAAREAVKEAALELGKIQGIDELKEPAK